MQKYKDFSPTPLDEVGLNAGEQGDWLVAPCSTNRDASVLYRANWDALLGELERVDPEGNDYEVNRYGHWACGWFEIILLKPGSKCEQVGIETEEFLKDYPILCEDTYSKLELSEFDECWDRWLASDAMDSLIKCMEDSGHDIEAFETDPDKYIPAQELDQMLRNATYWSMNEDGPTVSYYDFTEVYQHLDLPTNNLPLYHA